MPSRGSHVCFAPLGVVSGLAGRSGKLPQPGARRGEEAATQGAAGPHAGRAALPSPLPLGKGVRWLKVIPCFKAKAHLFLQIFQRAFSSVFVNKRELNRLSPTGKYLSLALCFKLVFQLF